MAMQGISKKELLSLFEKLSAWIEMLPQQQKTFVRLFLSTQNYSSIAKTADISHATVARRLKKIADRLSSNNFIITVLSQDSGQGDEKAEILKDYFVNALPVKKIAQNRGITSYQVRKIIRQTERAG